MSLPDRACLDYLRAKDKHKLVLRCCDYDYFREHYTKEMLSKYGLKYRITMEEYYQDTYYVWKMYPYVMLKDSDGSREVEQYTDFKTKKRYRERSEKMVLDFLDIDKLNYFELSAIRNSFFEDICKYITYVPNPNRVFIVSFLKLKNRVYVRSCNAEVAGKVGACCCNPNYNNKKHVLRVCYNCCPTQKDHDECNIRDDKIKMWFSRAKGGVYYHLRDKPKLIKYYLRNPHMTNKITVLRDLLKGGYLDKL